MSSTLARARGALTRRWFGRPPASPSPWGTNGGAGRRSASGGGGGGVAAKHGEEMTAAEIEELSVFNAVGGLAAAAVGGIAVFVVGAGATLGVATGAATMLGAQTLYYTCSALRTRQLDRE